VYFSSAVQVFKYVGSYVIKYFKLIFFASTSMFTYMFTKLLTHTTAYKYASHYLNK